MNIEFELRILEVDENEMIKKLETMGAEKVGVFDQKRYVYDFVPKRDNEWIRLRTNGTKTTLAYKNVEKNTVDGTKELEIEVSSLEETNEMLNILGYTPKSYQENRRVRYMLDGIEFDIDSWPRIPTYMELEGDSEEKVLDMLSKLDIPKEKITYLNCEDIYKEIYGINIDEIKDLRF